MKPVTLTIDGKEVKAEKGEKLLWVALDNGFYIPSLCAIKQADPPLSSCRLCFVEVEGKSSPVTACTELVTDGMIVHLNTPAVERLRNTAFELLLTCHKVECGNCAKNGNCELQNIARNLRLKLKTSRFRPILRESPIDSSHPLFTYDPNKCILCGKCVWICHKQSSGTLEFAFRGMDTMVTTFAGIPLAEAECAACLACVAVCPVGALITKPDVSMEKANALVAEVM